MLKSMIWTAAAMALTVWSCKTTTHHSQSQSAFGPLRLQPLPFACQQRGIPAQYQELAAYTKNHIARLLDASRVYLPEGLSAESFCYSYAEQLSGGASADSTGTIRIGYDIVRWVDSDADYAFVLAHELAHFLNSHGLPRTLPPELKNDPGSQEQLADELGLELYARAGYAHEHVTSFFENLLEAETLPSGQQQAQRSGIASELQGCVRGSHPDSCQRIKKLKSTLANQQEVFTEVVTVAPVINVFGDRLARLQEKLRPRP